MDFLISISHGNFTRAIFCLLALYPFTVSVKQTAGNESSTIVANEQFFNISSVQRDSIRKSNDSFQRGVGAKLHNQNMTFQRIEMNHSNTRGPFQLECQNDLYSFPHSEYLCASPDFSNNPNISKAHYTCADRCGFAPIYGNPLECACDALCFLYGDCCWDIPSACPQIYAQAKDVKASYVHGTLSHCAAYPSTLVIINDANKERQAINASSEPTSTTTSRPQPKKISPFSGGFNFIYLDWFMIADLSSGILFKNKEVVQSLELPVSVSSLSFVPKEAILKCIIGGFDAISRYSSAVRVVPNCKINDLHEVPTIFHRNCPTVSAMACPCELGQEIQSHYYDDCLEIVNSLFLRRYHGTLSHALDLGFTHLSNGEKCKNININFDQRRAGISFKNEMKIRITPFFPAIHTDYNGHLQPYAGEDDVENLSKQLIIKYVVEMAYVLEERLICNSMTNFPSHCQLDQCISQDLLLSNIPASSRGLFNDRSCIQPIRAKAWTSDVSAPSQIPLCTCSQLAGVLLAFGRWDVKVDNIRESLCLLWMNVFTHDKPAKEPMAPYTFSEIKSFNVSHSITVSSVWAQLQTKLIEEKEKNCPYDNFQELHVCLYYFDEQTLERPVKNVCSYFTVGSRSKTVRDSGYHVSMSCFILIIIMH
ncbi:hypothetical protein PoB_004939600 [Plakobranchus ocellatus]|uniref:SMB domain-containing protein n=1 Tax=Plakobranchus ocellatus TaxID=259542 RepID=A0AAV4BV02_9GAST|nr:hypothetical protein PoB_004939600 [Plakobranchus ocellatus]